MKSAIRTAALLFAVVISSASHATSHYPIMLDGKKWIVVPLPRSGVNRGSLATAMLISPGAKEHDVGTEADARTVATAYASKYARGCGFSRIIPGMGWIAEFSCPQGNRPRNSN